LKVVATAHQQRAASVLGAGPSFASKLTIPAFT
jgi:hypothetical protein